MTELELRQRRARDLERRLRALGIPCRMGALEPLEDERVTRTPAAVPDRSVAGPFLTGKITRRLGEVLQVR